jgi:hypothetical protein
VGSQQAWDVLNEYPSGSKLPNKAGEIKPKARARSLNPGSFSGLAEILAGEPSADEVHWFEFGSGEFGDVFILGHLRPMLLQHLSAERVNLDHPSALESGPVKAEVDSADTRE